MEYRRKKSAQYRDSSGYTPEEHPNSGQYYEEAQPLREEPPRRRRPTEERRPPSQTPDRRRPTEHRRPSSETPRRSRSTEESKPSSEAPRRRKPAGEPGTTRSQGGRGREARGKETPDRKRPSASPVGEKRPAPSRERSERSKEAERKRKELRAENARLNRLRRQQARKATRRTVKRIDQDLFKRLIIMISVVAAVLFSMIIFFRVDNIEVYGARFYEEEDIISQCGVATGDNLLTLSRGKVSGNIMAYRRYVESVKVERRLPDTLVIYVTECDPRYAVQDTEGNYFLMTADCKVLEQITAFEAKEFTLVQELVILTPTPGEEIQIQAEEGSDTKASGQMTALKALLKGIEEAALVKHIASVQIPSAHKVSLWYEDRFKVELGNTSQLDNKLEHLKAAVAKQESYVTGTIDLTFRDGVKVILLPEG